MWTALYVKELKEHRTLIMFLLGLTLCLEVVAVASVDGVSILSPSTLGGFSFADSSAHFLWCIAPYGTVLLLPFMLIHSFGQELKGNTHFLLLSLPVSRAVIFSAKLAAVITPGVVVFMVATAGVAIVIEALKEMAAGSGFFGDIEFSSADVFVLAATVYSSVMAVTLGIASGISGLKLVVQRFPGLAATAFSVFVLYIYFSYLGVALDLPKLFGTYEVTWLRDSVVRNGVTIQGGDKGTTLNFMFVAYSIFTGLWATGIGMWLFEKKMEA